MTRLAMFLMAATLAGCGAQPAPAFFGAPHKRVTRGGHDYVIYQTADRVEVIRLGYAPRGTQKAIRATMIALIPEVTGCRAVPGSLRGDSGEMRGRIDCR